MMSATLYEDRDENREPEESNHEEIVDSADFNARHARTLWKIFSKKRIALIKSPEVFHVRTYIMSIFEILHLNSKNKAGQTFLHFIFSEPFIFHRIILFALLGCGANLYEKNRDGKTALEIAIELENETIIIALLDFILQCKVGEIYLREKVSIDLQALKTEIIKAAAKSSQKVQEAVRKHLKYEAFLKSARYNDTESMQELLARGIDINCGSDKCLALIEAVVYNKPEALQILLAAGADPDRLEVSRQHPELIGTGIYCNSDPLNVAIKLGFTEIVEMMVNRGCALRESHLISAILSKNLNLSKFLLEAGAPLQKTKGNLKGTLYEALDYLPEMLPLLLQYGADINEPPADGPRINAFEYFQFNISYKLFDVHVQYGFPAKDAKTLKRDRQIAEVWLRKTEILIMQGAYPNLDPWFRYDFISFCSFESAKLAGMKQKFMEFQKYNDEAAIAKLAWEHREKLSSICSTPICEELFELLKYRKVMDCCLSPANITLLVRYAELEYFLSTSYDCTLKDRKNLEQIIYKIISEAVESLFEVHREELMAAFRKEGMERGKSWWNYFGIEEAVIDSWMERKLKLILLSILENILRANLSPVRALSPYLTYFENFFARQALPSGDIRNLIEEYVGVELNKSDLTKEKPSPPCLEVPFVSFGRFTSKAIKYDVRKLEQARFQAAKDVMGVEVEKRDTLLDKQELLDLAPDSDKVKLKKFS